MIPVTTVAEMRAVDEASTVPVNVLVERSAFAVYMAARRLMGGTYGRRVVVVAGPGNNGADGRVASRLLAQKGCAVEVLEPNQAPVRGGNAPPDLYIDAAFGTGFRGEYKPTFQVDAPVLAVDIPSGLDGDTGLGSGGLTAEVTVCLAALKPGHLFGSGPSVCGDVQVVDIGLDTSNVGLALLQRSDVDDALPALARDRHKWNTAVAVVAGSPGMIGSALLCCAAAMRTGAGMLRLISPGASTEQLPQSEVVAVQAPVDDWAKVAAGETDRCRALLVGPGLGKSEVTGQQVRQLLSQVNVPVVIDADGLRHIVGIDRTNHAQPWVLTPHQGEARRLLGRELSDKPWLDAQELAARYRATVVFKGPTTVIATPGQPSFVVTGPPNLATAGTGDVLAGVVVSLMAQGMSAHWAAASAAFIHGEAAAMGPSRGLVAGDLPKLIGDWLNGAAV